MKPFDPITEPPEELLPESSLEYLDKMKELCDKNGAELVLIHDAGDIGACIEECLQTALDMQKNEPNVWVPQQFENPANPEIQRNATAKELSELSGVASKSKLKVSGESDNVIAALLTVEGVTDVANEDEILKILGFHKVEETKDGQVISEELLKEILSYAGKAIGKEDFVKEFQQKSA